MSDVMLISPNSKHLLNNAGDRPPLGILYLGAVLKRRGHKVRVMDMNHYTPENLLGEVERNPPDYAGISVYTSPLFKQAMGMADKLNKHCKTIAGGYHASALPYSVLPNFTAVVIGEGEIALPKIIENNLTGLVKGEKMDINNIPKPARELVDMLDYNLEQDGNSAATLLSSRGCTNSCVYCGNMNRKMRFHSDRHVLKEVDQLKKYGYHDLYFYDDTFTANKKRAIQLVKQLKDKNVNYRITTRANTLDEELVKELADSGCTWVSLGIESGNDDRLKDIKKNMTTSDNLKAVMMLKDYGIKTKGFFMFGLPNETLENAEDTIWFSQRLKKAGLTSADFYIMTPFPGTPIWNNPEKFGIKILDRDYTKYLEIGKGPTRAFHRTQFMSQKDIEEIRNKAELEWAA